MTGKKAGFVTTKGCIMEYDSELARAVRMEREAEKKWQEAKRKVNELVGLVNEKAQRKTGKNGLTAEQLSRTILQ